MSSPVGGPKRTFEKEITPFINKRVLITLKDSTTISGDLKGVNPNNLTTILVKARNNETNTLYHRICLSGDSIATITLEEAPFDLAGLKDELEKIFNRPGDVKLYEEAGLIVVLERVKVSEHGVDGSGPVADRVRSIYERKRTSQSCA